MSDDEKHVESIVKELTYGGTYLPSFLAGYLVGLAMQAPAQPGALPRISHQQRQCPSPEVSPVPEIPLCLQQTQPAHNTLSSFL